MKTQSIEPLILFEDEELLILNKPPGIPCLPERFPGDAPVPVLTLARAHASPVFLCHRIDKFTSGVLVMAK